MIDNELESNIESDIENTISAVKGDDYRTALLEQARLFKTGWLELATILSKISTNGKYKEWGYKTLEQYCLKELHIRKNTVAKLLGNYHFMKKREPESLETKDIRNIPGFESTAALAKVSESGRMNEEKYQELKQDIIEKGYTPSTINKMLAKPKDIDSAEKKVILQKRMQRFISGIRSIFLSTGEIPPHVNQALKDIQDSMNETS